MAQIADLYRAGKQDEANEIAGKMIAVTPIPAPEDPKPAKTEKSAFERKTLPEKIDVPAFDNQVIRASYHDPVLVIFTAPWDPYSNKLKAGLEPLMRPYLDQGWKKVEFNIEDAKKAHLDSGGAIPDWTFQEDLINIRTLPTAMIVYNDTAIIVENLEASTFNSYMKDAHERLGIIRTDEIAVANAELAP